MHYGKPVNFVEIDSIVINVLVVVVANHTLVEIKKENFIDDEIVYLLDFDSVNAVVL